MNLPMLGAIALVLSAASHAQADDRRAGAVIYFHNITKSACHFNMTAESAERAAATLGMVGVRDPFFSAVFAVCVKR